MNRKWRPSTVPVVMRRDARVGDVARRAARSAASSRAGTPMRAGEDVGRAAGQAPQRACRVPARPLAASLAVPSPPDGDDQPGTRPRPPCAASSAAWNGMVGAHRLDRRARPRSAREHGGLRAVVDARGGGIEDDEDVHASNAEGCRAGTLRAMLGTRPDQP